MPFHPEGRGQRQCCASIYRHPGHVLPDGGLHSLQNRYAFAALRGVADAGAAATSPVASDEASGAVAITPAPSPGKELPEPFPSASSGPTVAS